MKHTILVIVIAVFAFWGCKSGDKNGGVSPEDIFDKGASYALGMNMGTSLRADNLFPDMDEFLQGMKDALYGSETRYTMEEAYMVFNEAYSAIAERREMRDRQAEAEFLAENSKKPRVNVTASGLQYEVISEGFGEKPTGFDSVRVHYEGTLVDGTVFDSSYERGEPVEFPLGAVIPGWTEGLQLMSVGSKYRLFVPSDLGYGPRGAGALIPPYSALIFEVELLGVIHDHDYDHDHD